MGTILLFTIQIMDTVLVQNSDQNSPSPVFKWFNHSYTGHLIAWYLEAFSFGVLRLSNGYCILLQYNPLLEKFSPGRMDACENNQNTVGIRNMGCPALG